ncbi:hypothetical protein E4U13_007182 [Claviceps humidiphila]|uniref:Aminoglycoside phosphotransferase domain-containing protein n=1 Tax=Claviceps humidiphila TaxID=1294629 RepID=A0A9P7TS10_9HYPO|nr:hypothetical protein E4U13_007182 [Claviceps humidiphila]
MNNLLVLNVAFSDDVCWIARILKAPVDPSYTRQHEIAMLSEIAMMKTLKSRTTIPVPEVFAFDVSPSNEFGFPYCEESDILPTRPKGQNTKLMRTSLVRDI